MNYLTLTFAFTPIFRFKESIMLRSQINEYVLSLSPQSDVLYNIISGTKLAVTPHHWKQSNN